MFESTKNLSKNVSTALNQTVIGVGKALNDLSSLRLTISSGAGFP